MFNPLDILRAPFRRDKLGMTPTDWFSLWLRRDALLTKLGSRKLWVTVAAAAIITFCGQMGLLPEICDNIVKLAQTYLGAEAAIDMVGAYRAAKS